MDVGGRVGVASAAVGQWPVLAYETLAWERDPDDMAMLSKSARRKIGSTYAAAVPLRIAERDVVVPQGLSTRIADLSARLARFDEMQVRRGYDLPALLLRSESAASSQIEHLTSSVRNVALAELSDDAPRNAREIVGNVAAMRTALAGPGEVTVDAMLDTHRALMSAGGRAFGGCLREEQVWIGGTPYSPHGALFVPPCASRVPGCLDDLAAFAQRCDLDPIVKAAVFHAQFETIHPFVDGNGRTGRALLHRALRDELLRHATLPLSTGLLHSVDAYMDALTAYQQGDPLPCIERLVEALELALAVGGRAARRIDAVLESWREGVSERAGSSIYRLPAVLVEQPVVNTAYVAERLGITPRAAQALVNRACEYGMLRATGNRRRGTFYQADALIDVLEDMAGDPSALRTRLG